MSVAGEERKRTILEKVEFKGKVKVSELAKRVFCINRNNSQVFRRIRS